jgi:hypothetical protein
MSLSLRRIAAVTAIAMSAAIMLAPQAHATTAPVTTKPVVTLMAADHKTPVGNAVYALTQTRATVWAVLNHPTANTDYTVNVVIVHVGFSSSTYKVCTFHAATAAKAGCIGTAAITLHHNDIPMVTVTQSSPTKTVASARI